MFKYLRFKYKKLLAFFLAFMVALEGFFFAPNAVAVSTVTSCMQQPSCAASIGLELGGAIVQYRSNSADTVPEFEVLGGEIIDNLTNSKYSPGVTVPRSKVSGGGSTNWTRKPDSPSSVSRKGIPVGRGGVGGAIGGILTNLAVNVGVRLVSDFVMSVLGESEIQQGVAIAKNNYCQTYPDVEVCGNKIYLTQAQYHTYFYQDIEYDSYEETATGALFKFTGTYLGSPTDISVSYQGDISFYLDFEAEVVVESSSSTRVRIYGITIIINVFTAPSGF